MWNISTSLCKFKQVKKIFFVLTSKLSMMTTYVFVDSTYLNSKDWNKLTTFLFLELKH